MDMSTTMAESVLESGVTFRLNNLNFVLDQMSHPADILDEVSIRRSIRRKVY